MSLLGVAGGVLTGLVGGLILQTVGIPWEFRLSVYGKAIGGGILLGVLFGVYPSLRAAQVKPAEVIRK